MGGVEVEEEEEAELEAEEKIIHYLKMPHLDTPQETMEVCHVLIFLNCLMSFLQGSSDLMESYLHAQGDFFFPASILMVMIFCSQCLKYDIPS